MRWTGRLAGWLGVGGGGSSRLGCKPAGCRRRRRCKPGQPGQPSRPASLSPIPLRDPRWDLEKSFRAASAVGWLASLDGRTATPKGGGPVYLAFWRNDHSNNHTGGVLLLHRNIHHDMHMIAAGGQASKQASLQYSLPRCRGNAFQASAAATARTMSSSLSRPCSLAPARPPKAGSCVTKDPRRA